jgi:hypothetical protein
MHLKSFAALGAALILASAACADVTGPDSQNANDTPRFGISTSPSGPRFGISTSPGVGQRVQVPNSSR